MKKIFALMLSVLLLAFGVVFFSACGKDESVIDVYMPDGAPALSMAQLMSEENDFDANVQYHVVNANTIQTYVTGENPDAELCVLPVNAAAQALMDRLRSPSTPLVEGKGRQFLVVSFETLRLGFWISNFGNWNFVRQQGESAALSIVTQGLAYQLSTGAVQLPGAPPVYASSISVLDETGVTRRDYLQEWFDKNPKASAAQRQRYLESRRNIHFLFNRVTGEKLAMDQRLYNSVMVQLLVGDPLSPRISPYFKLVYDNVFARIYEVL